jgi:DNA gyrase subunit A
VSAEDDLLLVSRKGQSVRFPADDGQLRPMGRATSGVTGMRFRPGDELLSMEKVSPGIDAYVLTATDAGWAKRTHVEDYRTQGRGGLGIRTHRLTEDRGSLVGALVVTEGDEVFAITSNGVAIRTPVVDVRVTGRDTMGVKLVNVGNGDAVVSVARNAERAAEDVIEAVADGDATVEPAGGTGVPTPSVEGDLATPQRDAAPGTGDYGSDDDDFPGGETVAPDDEE